MNELAPASACETYATRKSVLEAETIWRLTPNALVRERIGDPPANIWCKILKIGWRILVPYARPLASDTWPDCVAYGQITSIRLRFDPTRFDRTRQRCDLRGPNKANVSVFSTRFVAVANFEDQTKTYEPFVDELMRRVLKARPATPIYRGLTWWSYLVQHGLLLLTILALISVLGMAGVAGLNSIWAKLLIVLTYVGTSWGYMKRNWPRKIHPPKR